MKFKKIILTVFIFIFLLYGVVSFSYDKASTNLDEPKVAWVSHTEYWGGDHASTIVRLTDYKDNPLDISSCKVNILYPNKELFVVEQQMEKSGVPGNWYATSLLPNIPGTYEQEVICDYKNMQIKTSQSFHLNPALEHIKTLDKNQADISYDLSTAISKSQEIYSHTQEILQSAKNSDQDFNSKLDNLSVQLNDLSNYCSGSETNQSNLCSDVELLKNSVNYIKEEQASFEKKLADSEDTIIDTLSILLVENIDAILLKLDSLNSKTDKISNDTDSIIGKLDELSKTDNQIRVRIIS